MFGGPYSQSQNAPNLAEPHLNHFHHNQINGLNSTYKVQNSKNTFSIAQMAASTQQLPNHNKSNMPSLVHFDPNNPMSKIFGVYRFGRGVM